MPIPWITSPILVRFIRSTCAARKWTARQCEPRGPAHGKGRMGNSPLIRSEHKDVARQSRNQNPSQQTCQKNKKLRICYTKAQSHKERPLLKSYLSGLSLWLCVHSMWSYETTTLVFGHRPNRIAGAACGSSTRVTSSRVALLRWLSG